MEGCCQAYILFMQQSVSERIKKLRQEIAEIQAAYREPSKSRESSPKDRQDRRLQRLQEIIDELLALTDWKKT